MQLAEGVVYESESRSAAAKGVGPACAYPHKERVELFALSPREADLLALAVRGLLDRVTVPLARAAATFSDGFGWHEAGYARQSDSTRECFGRSSRWLRDLAWIGRSIALWPRLGAALCGDDGQPPLGQEAAYHIARVADETTIEAWIRHARKTKIRPLKQDVKQAMEDGRKSPPDAETDTESISKTDAAGSTPCVTDM